MEARGVLEDTQLLMPDIQSQEYFFRMDCDGLTKFCHQERIIKSPPPLPGGKGCLGWYQTFSQSYEIWWGGRGLVLQSMRLKKEAVLGISDAHKGLLIQTLARAQRCIWTRRDISAPGDKQDRPPTASTTAELLDQPIFPVPCLLWNVKTAGPFCLGSLTIEVLRRENSRGRIYGGLN